MRATPDVDNRPAAGHPGHRARGLWHVGVVALYGAISVIVTYPLVGHFGSSLAGGGHDMWIYTWDIWWMAKSLTEGLNPYFTPYLYFPVGASLVFHSLWLPATVWSAVALRYMSLVACYNTLLLVSLSTAAAGAYALVYYLSRSVPAAFLGGLLYGFNASRLNQALAHPEQTMGLWLPLFVLAVLVLLRASHVRRRVAAVLAAGVLAVLATLTRPAFGLMSYYLLAFLLASSAVVRLTWKRAAGYFAAIALATVVLGSPYFALIARSWPAPPPPDAWHNKLTKSVSLVAYVLPPPDSVLWGWWSHSLYRRPPRAGKVAFLGVGLIALLGIGSVVLRRDRMWRFWILSGLFFALASLGPRLVVWQKITDIPLPYELLPGMTFVRTSNRMVPGAMLCFAVAGALAWKWLLDRVGRPVMGILCTAALAVVLVLEYISIPFPTIQATVPSFYHQIAASKDEFGLVEIPGNPRKADKLYLYYQTIHGKPIQTGHVSRIPDGTYRYIRSVPLLNYLEHGLAGEQSPRGRDIDVAADLQRLRADGFRYIIFHKRFPRRTFRPMNRKEQRVWRAVAQLIGPALYEDNMLAAFDLRREPNRLTFPRRP